MSSTYKLICMNHYPPIEIDDYGSTITTVQTAVETVLQLRAGKTEGLPGDMASHAKCFLMIGRYSYPLIELGCAGGMDPKGHYHNDVRWMDADYLRMMLYGVQNMPNGIRKYLAPDHLCFSGARLVQLIDHLDLTEKIEHATTMLEDSRNGDV